MRSHHWLTLILVSMLAWSFDRVTKLWVLDHPIFRALGPLEISLRFNPGGMGGILSRYPHTLLRIAFGTLGAFVFFFFLAIQFAIPQKMLRLRLGLCLVISGVMGNVLDRISWGY